MKQHTEEQQRNHLLAELYRGVQDAAPWQIFLQTLEDLLNADLVALGLKRPSPYHPGLVFVSNPKVAQRGQLDNRYGEEVASIDPFVELPAGQAITLHEHMRGEALEQHPFFRDYMRPRDYIYHLGLDIYQNNEVCVYIRAVRGETSVDFGSEEKALLSSLSPHLSNIMAILEREEKLIAERDAYQQVTNQLALGCIVLDKRGKVVSTNASAEQILQQTDALQIKQGQLFSPASATNQALKVLSAGSAKEDTPAHHPMTLTIARREQPQPLHLIAKPAHKGSLSSEALGTHRVLLLLAPEHQASVSAPEVSRMLGLTPSETRLVIELANGLSLDEIAEKISVSRNTLRTHLQRAFQKTGVNKQASLVALVLRAMASLNA